MLPLQGVDSGEIALTLCARADFESSGLSIGEHHKTHKALRGKPPGWLAPPGWTPPAERSTKISSKAVPIYNKSPSFESDGPPVVSNTKTSKDPPPIFQEAPANYLTIIKGAFSI